MKRVAIFFCLICVVILFSISANAVSEENTTSYYIASNCELYEYGINDNDEYEFTFYDLINLADFSVLSECTATVEDVEAFEKVIYAFESGGAICIDSLGHVTAASLTPAEIISSLWGGGNFAATVSGFEDADTIVLKNGETVVVDSDKSVNIKATVYTLNLSGVDFDSVGKDTMYVSDMEVAEGVSDSETISIDGTKRYLYPLTLDHGKQEISGPVSGVLTELDYAVSDSGNCIYAADEAGEYNESFFVELNTVASYDEETQTVSLFVIKTIRRHVHLGGEWVVTVEPTMTKRGEQEKYCIFCGKKLKSRSIPALGPATYGDYEYIAEDGEVTITKYNGKDAIPDIPSKIDGLPVTKIGERAFYDNLKLEKLIVPSGVKEIGNSAFENCGELYSIELPEGLLTIGEKAFSECFDSFGENVVFVDLPESITYIGKNAFSSCFGLSYIDMPDSLLETGEGVFRDCYNLREIVLPEGLVEISSRMFISHRMGLDRLYIPKSVKEIGENAFWEIEYEAGVTLYEVYYGGSAEDFLSIHFGDGNTQLFNSDIVFGASAYSFNTNGGDYILPVISTDGIAEMPIPVREGYAFAGWYNNAGLSGDKVVFPYKTEGTVTLYAKWEIAADIDGDGTVTLLDALNAIDMLINKVSDNNADVNGDGKLSLADILLIIKSMA